MAYSSTNGPAIISQTFGSGTNLWAYKSTHTVAAVAASSFFSNGYDLSMKAGDPIYVTQVTTANAYTAHAWGAVSAVTSGAGATVVFTATSS